VGDPSGVYCAHHNVQHLLYLLDVGAYAAHPVRTMYVGYGELLVHTTRGRSNGAGLNVLARYISAITSPASLAIAGRKVLYTIRFTGRVLEMRRGGMGRRYSLIGES
jgi:hypothetical protein